jgi:hypothetical protein
VKYDPATEKWFLRNSERKSFKQCRWKWKKNYVEGMAPKRASQPLVFGSLIHDALEKWYIPGRERGVDPLTTFIQDFAEADANGTIPQGVMYDEEGKYGGMFEMGKHLLGKYVEHYGPERHIEIIQPEQKFWLDIYDTREGGDGSYVVTATGTMDALYLDHNDGRYNMLEHKSWKVMRTQHLQLDEQASTYWALVPLWLRQQGFFGPDDDLGVMMYNIIRKANPDDRPQNSQGMYLNKNGSVSKRQPAEIYHRVPIWRDTHSRRHLLDRLIAEANEIKMVQAGLLMAYKNPTYTCGSCDFFDACELDEVNADVYEYLSMTTNPYDPYSGYAEEPKLRSQ